MVCLLIAIFSSYKLLAVPDLKPGDIAQVNVIAPRDAKVIDTTDLKEKKQGLKENFVQSIDKNKSNNLEKTIFKKINTLRTLKAKNYEIDLNEINLTNLELSLIHI